MNKRHYEHTLPNIRGSLSNTYLKEYFREKFREDGIYEIYCAWKGGSAHVFCAEVTEGKTRFFDPQTGKDDASNYIQSMKAGRVGVIRIDNKLVNPKIMGLFITK